MKYLKVILIVMVFFISSCADFDSDDFGACIDEDDYCMNTLQKDCSGDWHPNTTCDDLGYVIPVN
jgi:hypothetical protein